MRIVFFAAIVVAFGWFLWQMDWATMRDAQFDPLLLAVSLVLTLGHRYYGVLAWRIVLSLLGSRYLPPFQVLADVYSKAWLARYIPGTIPWVAGRVYLAAAEGISHSRLAVASFVEAGAQVVGVGIVSLGLLAYDGRIGETAPFLRAMAATGAVLLAMVMVPRVLNRMIALGLRLLRRDTEIAVSWRSVCTSVALYAWGALLSGVGLTVFSHALISTLTASDTAFLVGAFGLSGVIGMLTPLVPAGLGTRDGAQFVLLLVIMPAPEAALLVIASRLWSALIDVIFWVSAVVMRRVGLGE